MVMLLIPLNPSTGALTDILGGVSSTKNWNKFVVDIPAESTAVTVIVLFPVAPAQEPWNGFMPLLFVNTPPVELQLDVKLMFLKVTVEATTAEKLRPVFEVIVDWFVMEPPVSTLLNDIVGVTPVCIVKLCIYNSELPHVS